MRAALVVLLSLVARLSLAWQTPPPPRVPVIARRTVLALFTPAAAHAFDLPTLDGIQGAMVPFTVEDPDAVRTYAAQANPDRSRQYICALYAINEGDMGSLQAMADGEWALADLVDGDSLRTLLHRAAQVGNEPAVKLLLRLGSPIDAYTKLQETPLHLAVRNNRLACVKALVEAGASTSALYSKDDDTALSLARKYRFQSIVEYLTSKGAPEGQPRVPIALKIDAGLRPGR